MATPARALAHSARADPRAVGIPCEKGRRVGSGIRAGCADEEVPPFERRGRAETVGGEGRTAEEPPAAGPHRRIARDLDGFLAPVLESPSIQDRRPRDVAQAL